MPAGGRLDRNSLALADAGKMPFGDGLLAPQRPFLENADRHSECHIPTLDVHTSAPDFIVRNIFDKRWQPHSAPPVKQLGGGIDDSANALVKPLTQVNTLIASHGLFPFAVPGQRFASAAPHIPSAA